MGREAIALIFDQLYVSISDLATVPQTKQEERTTSKMSTALTTTSSVGGTTLAVEDPKNNLSSRVPPTRGWTSKIFPDREPQKEVFNSLLSPSLNIKANSPSWCLQSRRSFMNELFRKESEVYQVLEDLQGQFIPKCWGTFYIKFKKRELPDD